MRKAKNILCALLCLMLIFSLTACGSKDPDVHPDAGQTDVKPSQSVSGDIPSAEKGTLVVVFSATGNTRAVADIIAEHTGADIYEIIPKEPYSEEDLNWHDKKSRSTIEMNDPGSRPEIGSEKISLDGYSTIFIGYPIWWGEEPRILCTFVESHDFTDKTVIPFCTSGGSGMGRSGEDLAKLAGTGNWLKGTRHSGSISEDELLAWVEGLK